MLQASDVQKFVVSDTIPGQIDNPTPAQYLEVMSRAVFQAGLRWAGIAKNWECYCEAFSRFEPDAVAKYTEGDIDRLMRTDGILHSARKIRGVIANAQALITLAHEHGNIRAYLRSFPDYASLSKDIRKRFAFMGEMNVWYFLFRTCEPVPQFEHWVTTIPGDHPRMKEMVEKARSAGTSTEY
ncbi:MAG TPA: DNA-3-methyladenine glycosylase I [Candidatus Baltobacteraceae bacterium]|jgi:3-methyladenine DNA glycosylase Tag|nr:DNA-3-methyladenine glycosylase I [Candidatus Baltobacteraceae bacterium]